MNPFGFALLAAIAIIGSSPAVADSTTVIQRDNSNKPVPRFAYGWTLFYERDAQRVLAYDAAGRLQFDIELHVPEAKQIRIRDLTASPSGRVVVSAAAALSEDQRQSASVLIFLSPAGQLERVVKTGTFGASRLIFSPSEHLWALGLERTSSGEEDPAHNTVREYDSNGLFLKSFLPRSSFAKSPSSTAILVANQQKLGIVSPADQEYVELEWSGAIAVRVPLKLYSLETNSIAGAALTADGNLFVATSDGSGNTVTHSLDRSSGQFARTQHFSRNPEVRPVLLVGSSGNDLVAYGHPASGNATATISRLTQ